MNADQIRVIERLRTAAKEHGEVSDLLDVLRECLLLDDRGNKAIVGDDEQIEYLKAAIFASDFAAYDRSIGAGEG